MRRRQRGERLRDVPRARLESEESCRGKPHQRRCAVLSSPPCAQKGRGGGAERWALAFDGCTGHRHDEPCPCGSTGLGAGSADLKSGSASRRSDCTVPLRTALLLRGCPSTRMEVREPRAECDELLAVVQRAVGDDAAQRCTAALMAQGVSAVVDWFVLETADEDLCRDLLSDVAAAESLTRVQVAKLRLALRGQSARVLPGAPERRGRRAAAAVELVPSIYAAEPARGCVRIHEPTGLVPRRLRRARRPPAARGVHGTVTDFHLVSVRRVSYYSANA